MYIANIECSYFVSLNTIGLVVLIIILTYSEIILIFFIQVYLIVVAPKKIMLIKTLFFHKNKILFVV